MQDNDKLMSRDELLAALFTDDMRPCARTFADWKAKRWIPYVKLGKIHAYNLAEVRKALAERNTIKAVLPRNAGGAA